MNKWKEWANNPKKKLVCQVIVRFISSWMSFEKAVEYLDESILTPDFQDLIHTAIIICKAHNWNTLDIEHNMA